ncbi:RING finger domain-containing protein [Giardia duodenalis]|uniref:RING finger domain-containing protein n=2 Tax=Giardia intestinalis TaxID=5741 RepID=A8B9E6_GIAIC|nr:RING finger domain-containing protein [Giardia intestinalis]ESU34843.1 Hypothetical protein DHA2_21792 [Giardia intestinalis]KAE8306135.1 RING finger domain-containing protein [Giardia intestinalis]|eukprot:XP_001708467.1 Hypothetical protein GL50803_21792 [Giardia lamblia ATCC 50803]
MLPRPVVDILPDRSSYLPGAVIFGKVAITMAGNLQIDRASIILTQVEKAKVRWLGFTVGSGEKVHYLLTQHILRPRSPTHSPIILSKGLIHLPFSLKIPSDAPPSLAIDSDNFCKASLSFTIVAQNDLIFRWSTSITILPVFVPIASYDTILERHDVKLALKPVQSAFDKTDIVRANWSVDNQSSSKVSELSLSLHAKAVVRCDGGRTKQLSEALMERSLLSMPMRKGARRSGCIEFDLTQLSRLDYSVPSSSPIVRRTDSKPILTGYLTLDYVLRLLVVHKGQQLKLKIPIYILPLHATPLPSSPTIVVSQLKTELSLHELQLQRTRELAASQKVEIEQLKERLSRSGNSEVCCICLENDASIVFIPCGHFCTCRVCDRSLTRRQCPICRKNIESSYAIYK